jgi:hypothetical protein
VEHERLVAHNYAVVEATAIVYRRLGYDAVRDFHMQLLRPIDIVWVDPETHDLAVRRSSPARKSRSSTG